MLTHHNCSIFAIDFERTCVLTDIKEPSLKSLVTATHLLFTAIQKGMFFFSVLTKNTEPPPQPEGTGLTNRLFLATRIPAN